MFFEKRTDFLHDFGLLEELLFGLEMGNSSNTIVLETLKYFTEPWRCSRPLGFLYTKNADLETVRALRSTSEVFVGLI